MDRRRFLATVGAVATPLVAGCGGGGGGGDDTTTPPPDTAKTITMEGTSFKPMVVEVDAGATVKWVNNDSSVVAHYVTSGQLVDNATEWDLDETTAEGESFTHKFEEKGVYTFYSQTSGKSSMCGAVLVGGATMQGTLPCAD
ncbi:MAG: plastocyanin/azurin family copper-binding protein [Halobacteriaceae archaeon]